MKTKSSLVTLVAAALLLASCSTTKEKNLAYFKDLAAQQNGTIATAPYSDITIRTDDELIISVTSKVPEATAMFNVPLNNPALRSELAGTSQPRVQTYIVDSTGDIVLPVLGRKHVAGLSTRQLADEIRAEVEKQVHDPYVRVELLSVPVNVIGEVRNPQRLQLHQQRCTVIDALAACNDLTEFAKRDDIIVIRTEGGKTTYGHLNLSSSDLFASPYYYLKQNDIVYVEPNQIKTDNSKYNQNNAYKLTVISTIVSAASVIASLVIALAVK